MDYVSELLLIVTGFVIVAVAAGQISLIFPSIKLPIITGLLFIGILAGPYVLRLLSHDVIPKLNFINEISLAFIAFAAGAELYLKELNNRLRSIKWMTFGQLFFTFVFGGFCVWLLADYIPFMRFMGWQLKLAIALLIGTIFVARSPVSAIAVINEMRAKGPFTQTALGVTVVKDVLVIVLFTLCFAFADALIHKIPLDVWLIVILILELSLSFLLGYLLGQIMKWIMHFRLPGLMKSLMLLALGYSVYLLSHLVHFESQRYLGFDVYIEPLLICIIGSFLVVNYSSHRREFRKLISENVTIVYIAFFTLTGASISLDILVHSWGVALLFFGIRLITMAIGAYVGGNLGGDPQKFNRISWMPYVTQAGVALGLVAVISNKYPSWGPEFATILITVIVLNQIVGPPLFRWSILHVGESHLKGKAAAHKGVQRAIVFGLEGQSLALARQLIQHEWEVKVLTRNEAKAYQEYQGVNVELIRDFSLQELKRVGTDQADAIILMNRDDDNLLVSEMAYEHFGTRDIVVRVHERSYLRRFHELGALIVDPNTAMVSLLDHMVRSPVATSLLLGFDQGQDTIDVEMQNPNLHGIPIRDLKLPADIIIMATKRQNNTLISTGYTVLRLGDVLTVVGSIESLEKVKLKMEGTGKRERKLGRSARRSVLFRKRK